MFVAVVHSVKNVRGHVRWLQQFRRRVESWWEVASCIGLQGVTLGVGVGSGRSSKVNFLALDIEGVYKVYNSGPEQAQGFVGSRGSGGGGDKYPAR
jgi:hypothetical protein